MAAPKGNVDSTGGHNLEQLYLKHYESLVRCAMRLLDTRHLAEEAVQEAFLGYHAIATKPQRGCELAYLRMSAMNKARSMMRRKQCAERWRPEMPRVAPAVDEICVKRDADHRLLARCALLPDRQRTVLKLYYWEGFSVAEIARALAISTGSVKTHASRGRAALRDQLVDNAA